ncbi:energy transducer TonB [Sphingomonas sp.]|uniref:energy transducer TonB n=1 Tax=Sphingomonas sp. TaxID=28214 RepID=UPI0038A30441
MFWIALAAQLSAPVPAGVRLPDVRALFSPDDFPAYLQMEGVSRTVHTRTTVRPDGSIESCVTEESSGDARLDAYTCGLIVKRATFQPAKWIDGTPVYGVIRAPVSWRISDGTPTETEMLKSAEPDIDLAVNQLPKGAGSIAVFDVEIGAYANGRGAICAEHPADAMRSKKHFPELVAIACQKVMTDYPVVPPVDLSGKPVRSVQTVSVRFMKSH